MKDLHLLDIYRAVHEQVFLPIFVQDHFDTKTLVEACVQAGCKCIEYTLRRADADEMIFVHEGLSSKTNNSCGRHTHLV